MNSCYQEVGEGPSTGYSRQETFPIPTYWGDYPQEDKFPSNSFEATVMKRFDALQAQIDRMALGNEGIGVRLRSNLQTDMIVMETVLRNWFEEKFQAYEERSIKRFEEHYTKIESMLMKLDSRLQTLEGKFESLVWSSRTVDCRVDKLEQRTGQLCFEMYKTQGQIVQSESDDDCVECLYFEKELPGCVGQSVEENEENAGYDNSAAQCELITQCAPIPSSLASCAYKKDERLLCEDIAFPRGSFLAHSIDIEATREGDSMAYSPVKNRNHSFSTNLPLHQDESSWLPPSQTCYSCELACTPQVRACFGVLASSASREKLHEDPSWEDDDSMDGFAEHERDRKKQRRASTQVWIPRGALDVMKVFYMTEISLGENTGVPLEVKQRKRRRKSSHPSGRIRRS